MSEQKKTIFTDLRDKHGVTDLLREVSARKSALTPKHRREVNNIVDRMGGGSHTSSDTEDHSESSSLDDGDKPSGPMNNWGNKFLQKLNRQAPQNPLKANNPPQFFRKFSIQRVQKEQEREDDPSNGEKSNDRREEILKSLERSQQQGKEILQRSQEQGKEILQRSQEQGKEMLQRSQEQGKEILQKFSSNFQNFSNNVRTSSNFQNFSNNVKASLNIQTNADMAAEIEQTMKELEKISTHSRRSRPLDFEPFASTSNHSRHSIGKASNHSISSFDGDII